MKLSIKFLNTLILLAMVFTVANVVNAEQGDGLQKDFLAPAPTPVVTPVSTPIVVVSESQQGVRVAAPTPTPVNPTPTPVITVVTGHQGQAPVQNPVSSGSSSGSSGSYSSGGYSSSKPLILSTSCPVVTTLLKKGINNSSTEVTKLQNFLKDTEKLSVDVNGKFDDKTETAVIAFQNKYKDSVLVPWGATKASGIVYITTASKINNIACGRPMTLSASDLAIIKSYNATEDSSAISPVQVQVSTPTPSVKTGDVGVKNSPESNTTNTASASNASVVGSFWNFVKGLFSSKK